MKYLIMHGSFGSPDDNWFRWLEKTVKDQGNEVILEQFPVDDWDVINKLGKENRDQYSVIQTVAKWEDFFLKNIFPKLENERICFIGHSLAPLFLLHLLEKYNLDIELAIFVSPFLDLKDKDDIWQFYPVNKDFYTLMGTSKKEFDFIKIKKNIKESFVIYGDDDPYVSYQSIKEFSSKLGSKEIMIKGGKHCGSNFTDFPQILEILLNKKN